MQLKSTHEQLKVQNTTTTTAGRKTIMATANEDDNGSRVSHNSSTNNNNNNSTSSNNNNNKDDNNSTTSNQTQMNDAEIKLKKQTLEQRKQELEKLLSEKNWLLQQLQKQETQILNGNYEYLNVNEIFQTLSQQYKHEQVGGGSGSSAILRRKAASKENQQNNNNRQSEISNRSSEYDNYPSGSADAGGSGGVMIAQQQQPPMAKSALKKRATPTPSAASLNYIQLQRQQQQQQHLLQQQLLEQQMLQQHAVEQQMLQQHAVEQQMLQQHLQKQQKLLQHTHYHQQQRLFTQQQQQQQPHTDAISLYSVNSANVATLRQQHIAPQQQPIVVQCDKYYLSPTHQSYNDGGFIKSSQNIKKYISPLASPTQFPNTSSNSYEQQHQQQQPQLQLLHALPAQHTRQLDAISLAPSYVSLDAESAAHHLRWRSQTHIPHAGQQPQAADAKSHSSDMLAHSSGSINYYSQQAVSLKSKPLDEISISSLASESQKKSKPKQWLESSLDGPAIRSQGAGEAHALEHSINQSVRLPHKSHMARERAKLSSQSMSSGRHYSMSSAQKNPHSAKLLQDDDGRYAKLSQSTSYLNNMETTAPSISPAYPIDGTPIDISTGFRCLPPKPNTLGSGGPQPPPRPPPVAEKIALTVVTTPIVAAVAASSLSPEIRIESPKNVHIVQQATFQPYKEETKPFEMSDFYKYSTKFRQKENTSMEHQ